MTPAVGDGTPAAEVNATRFGDQIRSHRGRASSDSPEQDYPQNAAKRPADFALARMNAAAAEFPPAFPAAARLGAESHIFDDNWSF